MTELKKKSFLLYLFVLLFDSHYLKYIKACEILWFVKHFKILITGLKKT